MGFIGLASTKERRWQKPEAPFGCVSQSGSCQLRGTDGQTSRKESPENTWMDSQTDTHTIKRLTTILRHKTHASPLIKGTCSSIFSHPCFHFLINIFNLYDYWITRTLTSYEALFYTRATTFHSLIYLPDRNYEIILLV